MTKLLVDYVKGWAKWLDSASREEIAEVVESGRLEAPILGGSAVGAQKVDA